MAVPYYGEDHSPTGVGAGTGCTGPLVGLTEHNDPIGKRAKAAGVEISAEEVHSFSFADPLGCLSFGSEGNAVCEWGMEVVSLKSGGGLDLLEAIHGSTGVHEIAHVIQRSERCFFRLSRQLPEVLFFSLFREVKDDGWCGWVALEWLERRSRDPACLPLQVVVKKDAMALRKFLSDKVPEGPCRCGDVMLQC